MATRTFKFSVGAAALAAILSAGCGGGGSVGTIGGTGVVTLGGNLGNVVTALATETVTAPNGKPVPTSVLVEGAPVTVLLAGGASITAGDRVSVILPEKQAMVGLSAKSGSEAGIEFGEDGGPSKDSGLVIRSDGTVHAKSGLGVSGAGMVLVPASGTSRATPPTINKTIYRYFTIKGPITWVSQVPGAPTSFLTIRVSIGIQYPVNQTYTWNLLPIPHYDLAEVDAFPSALAGTIPANGTVSTGLSFNYDTDPAFANFPNKLRIYQRPGNGTLDMSKTVTANGSGHVVISNDVPNPHDTINALGVNTVGLMIGNPPSPRF